jgi:predicted transcriptional regulator
MASGFKWTENKVQASALLADGRTQVDVAAECGVTDRTIRLWLQEEEFSKEVDRLSLIMGIASRAERLRLAKRVIRQLTGADGYLRTEKDALDWVKFAQSETDGIKLDLVKLAAAVGEEEAGGEKPDSSRSAAIGTTDAPLADSGSD